MMNSNNFFFVCLFFLFNFNNFWKVLWEVLLIKSCELQMTTLRMKYMNRQGTSCFRARTWATPDFSISQWGEGVHLARGQRHTQAAHTAGCDLEQTESLSSNNSASFSTAGVGPASQGCPLWPNAIPCPLLALSLCSPSPTRSQNVAKTQAMIGRRGAGVPLETPPLWSRYVMAVARLQSSRGWSRRQWGLRLIHCGFRLARSRHSIPHLLLCAFISLFVQRYLRDC